MNFLTKFLIHNGIQMQPKNELWIFHRVLKKSFLNVRDFFIAFDVLFVANQLNLRVSNRKHKASLQNSKAIMIQTNIEKTTTKE